MIINYSRCVLNTAKAVTVVQLRKMHYTHMCRIITLPEEFIIKIKAKEMEVIKLNPILELVSNY